MLQAMLWPAALLGALGLIFGAVLAVANRFFGVEVDGRIIRVRESLPGANCGGCGYPGCDACAAAIVEGKAPVNVCPVNSAEGAAQVAKILGVDVADVKPLTTFVTCRGSLSRTHIKYAYEGIQDCAAAMQLTEGYKACRYACLGLGNCARVCPTGAMSIVDGLAVIDQDKCITCGKCVSACPRGIITMLPADSQVRLQCHAMARGKEVRDACQMGCIGCGLCVKSCKFGAITLVNDLPVIDYDKCTGCGECARHCPRGCLWRDPDAKDRVAFIRENQCVGCGLCQKACKFDAIAGENRDKRVVDPTRCVGCGECQRACRLDAVAMIEK